MDEISDERVQVFKPNDKVPPYQLRAYVANNKLSWSANIHKDSRPFSFVKTSIVATIGPSSSEVSTLEKMIEAGMRVARLNTNFGTQESLLDALNKIRQATKNYGERHGCYCPLAVALDTKGPTIRTGFLEDDKEIILQPGGTFKLTTDRAFYEKGNEEQIYLDYDNIQKSIRQGNVIFIDNGLIRLIVQSVQGNVITTEVQVGNKLGNQKIVNLPQVNVDLPAITERDKEDFQFAIENNIDIILISFVRTSDCIREVRKLLGPEGKNILIFAKIQNQQGLDNVIDILEAADGIVIVRGVLAIELPIEKLLQTQKYLIAKCNLIGKPCLITSQFLGGMVRDIKPTSAEANDLANTANEGAQCIMLSSITAIGLYPVECVQMAAKLCRQGEACIWQRNVFDELLLQFTQNDDYYVIAIAAARLAFMMEASAIIVATTSGKTAFGISQFLPRCLIVAVTRSEVVARHCSVHRGIIPVLYNRERKYSWRRDMEARIQFGMLYCQTRKIVETGDPVIIVTSTRHGHPNTVRVVYMTAIPEKVYF